MNPRIVHVTQPKHPNDPIQIAFAVSDNGVERIETATLSDSKTLHDVCERNGWFGEQGGLQLGRRRTA